MTTTVQVNETRAAIRLRVTSPSLRAPQTPAHVRVTNESAEVIANASPVVVRGGGTSTAPVVRHATAVVVTATEQGPAGPPGPVGPGNDIVLGEELTGAINGSNATFTTDHDFVPGTVVVRVNGLSQRLVTDFQTSGTTTITFTDSPQPGDYLAVDYERA